MDNNAPGRSILDTLRTVEFRLGLKGYNVDEVDEYLEKAAVEAEQVQERLRAANERLRQATERIAQLEAEPQRPPAERAGAPQPAATAPPAPPAAAPGPGAAVTEDALQRTLLLAQKFVEETKRESEAEAAQVVSRAEERARTLLSQAEERARRITTEAEDRLREEVARLEDTRKRLLDDVEAMSRHVEEQRAKIRASLAEALRWVDERIQPPDGTLDNPHAGPSAARKPTGSGAALSRKPDPAGPSAPGPTTTGSSVATTAPSDSAPRPQLTPAATGAQERHGAEQPPSERPPATDVPSHAAGERAPAAAGARLGVLSGGLFGAGRDETNGAEGNRPGE